MARKKITFKNLGELSSLFLDSDAAENNSGYGNNREISIPDPFGVALEQDSGITETDVFVTQFSPDDVNYFIKLLSDNPPAQHRYNLENILTASLKDWCYDHPDECPYEPFLWALKATDNFVGSLQNNQKPKPWIIGAVGNALSSVWDNGNPLFIKVLYNVIETWDWYQPVHIMISLYQFVFLNDDGLDKKLREHWLYRALYYTTTFNCLCQKRKTSENIQALMSFVSQDTQIDLNEAEIQITKKMRQSIRDYILNASKEEFAIAKTYYTDALYNCSHNARLFYEDIFSKDDNDAKDILTIMNEWKKPHTENELKALRHKLGVLFQKYEVRLIEEAAKGSPDFIRETLSIVDQQTTDFNMQFILKAMLKNISSCREYARYIEDKYNKYGDEFSDEKSFLFGCAYCQLGHPEILEKLFYAHFLQSIGAKNARFFFSDIRNHYPKQYSEQIQNIVSGCLEDDSQAFALVLACAKIYTSKTASSYPVQFDQVCNCLLKIVLEKSDESTRYASALMDLYERIANVQNRERYQEPLTNIINTRSIYLQNVKTRAKKVLRDIYSAI